ncbi:MAG: hypothetical protein ABIK97_02440 [candidate division WOR-3 bacterium]
MADLLENEYRFRGNFRTAIIQPLFPSLFFFSHPFFPLFSYQSQISRRD